MDQSQTDDAPGGVEDVLAELDDLAAGHSRVRVADVLDDFGKRSFGPFILVPALIELSPIGGIPGLPTFIALFIAIVAVQLFMGRDHVWMPQFIQQRAVSGRRLHRAVGKLRRIAHWLDEHSHGRLEALTQGVWPRVAAVIIIVLCCTVPPLEFIPFASSAPMLAIAAFGLALTVRDGLLMLVALALGAGAVGAGGYWLVARPTG